MIYTHVLNRSGLGSIARLIGSREAEIGRRLLGR